MRTLAEKRLSLLTKPEEELVLSSDPSRIGELSERQLRTRIARSRSMAEKYEDLARRQQREATGRRTPTRSRRAQGNENTRRKAAYFEKTTARFEKQLAKLERQKAKASRPSPARPARRRVGPGRSPAATGALRTASHASARSATLAEPPVRPPRVTSRAPRKEQRTPGIQRQAHARAAGRRRQARKDRR